VRVVVLRALGLGDLLTAVPALRAIRRAHPCAHVALAAPRVLAPLVDLVGGVDEVVDTAPLAPLDPSLSGADLAVNLHGRGPQSTALLRASRPRRLVSYGLEGGPVWRADEHEVRRWCRLLAESGIPADPAELDVAAPSDPPPVRGAVVVHPGAAYGSRRWPAERWGAVAGALPGPVVVTAGPGEEPLAASVAAHAGLPPDAVLSGLSLRQLAGLVASARLLLSPDTGVAHLATAVGTPSVVLFGPVDPARWGPPAERPQHVALWAGVPSQNASDEPAPALLALTPARVLAAARRLIA
jgi:ADP-heptose:LPS heptosyltransferase